MVWSFQIVKQMINEWMVILLEVACAIKKDYRVGLFDHDINRSHVTAVRLTRIDVN